MVATNPRIDEATPSGSASQVLMHDLTQHFEQIRQFESTPSFRQSPLYQQIRGEIGRVMQTVLAGQFATPLARREKTPLRAVAWNIERGTNLDGIIRTLRDHPRLSGADVYLLTELDYGMARSHNRFVVEDIARALNLNYVFAPCYISLVKGSGLEAQVSGEDELSLHGNALLSPHPIQGAHSVALPNGKDLMRGKEKRLGYQQAVVGLLNLPQGPMRAVSVHLDAHSSQRHRQKQMGLILDDLDDFHPASPSLVGGDWNTSTYNSRNATLSILGYCRRVLMGPKRVIRKHYPFPDRWFERHLFRELENRGYRYRELNEAGACTLHYTVEDVAINTNMADWIPKWCFWWITWALKASGGKCSMKLDWMAGQGLKPDPKSLPTVVSEVNQPNRLSDHDPIALDFTIHSID